MTEHTVGEYLPEEPFRIGGPLEFDTGRQLFVPLDQHWRLEDKVKKNRMRRMSIWTLSGPYGIGRTWTQAWMGRRAAEDNLGMGEDDRWEASLVSGLGEGRMRDFIQSLFASTAYLKKEVNKTETQSLSTQFDDDYEAIMSQALSDRSVWSVFEGNRGQFPSMRHVDLRPPWTNRETQVAFLSLWLRRLKAIDVEYLLILVDEFESLITRLSTSKLTSFSDGLRRLYDVIESGGDEMPNVQVVLSSTPESANRIDPSASSQELAGWLEPLKRRMDNQFRLSKITEEEAKNIAANCMEVQRLIDPNGNEFTPYEEVAIEIAYEASDGIVADFAKSLNEMYISCYDEMTIDEDDAMQAVDFLGFEV